MEVHYPVGMPFVSYREKKNNSTFGNEILWDCFDNLLLLLITLTMAATFTVEIEIERGGADN